MIRMLVVGEDTSDIAGLVLRSGLSSGRAATAIAALQTLNPHADLAKLSAGTVLLVPDAAGFKTSASVSVSGQAFAGFKQLVQNALSSAANDLKTSSAARAADRAEVTAVVESDAFKRLLDADAALKQQVAHAIKAFADEQQQAEQAEQAIADVSKSVLASLTQLGKLVG
jgi:hypothetical protein